MKSSLRPSPSTAREFHFPHFETLQVNNGLTVVVAPMHRLPVVTAMLVLEGGAMREIRGKEGAAELTARALLEGTSSRSAYDLVQSLELLGASVSASADWDTTVLRMTVMAARLPDALELMSEMAREPRFSDESISRIRSERLSEIIQAESEPRVLADETFSHVLYDENSRYATPLGGREQTVTHMSRDDIVRYHSRTYRPAASTLILAGDVGVDEARRSAEAAFGNWTACSESAGQTGEAEAKETSVRLHVVDRSGAQQSEVRVGHVGVPRSCPDYFPIVVMNAVLGGLFSSRINLNLREVHGYTYGASSYFDWRRKSGPFVVATAVQTEVTGAAITEVLNEIRKIQADKITDDELSLASDYLAGVFPIRYETTDAVASGLANLIIFDLPADYFTTYRERITSVTAEDVQKAALRYLNANDISIVVAGNSSLVGPQLSDLGLGEVQRHGAAQ